MKHFLLLLFIFSTSVLAHGQTGNISGVVKDHHGKSVPGASVTLRETGKMTTTDDQGKFLIKAVPYGNYTLSVSSMITESRNLNVKVDRAEVLVNVTAKAAKEKELKQVSITGKSRKREIETSGFAVNVVDTKEAALRNLQTNELLDRTVGVRVRQSGGLGSNAEYNLNGMSGRAIGVFIDGIEISTYGSSFNLNNIPPAMIERIEVYKGVLPAHLAGDFLGGGINIILKKGARRNSLNAALSYGSFNTQQADLSAMYRNVNSGLTFRGSGFYSYSDNNYEVWGQWVKNLLPDGREELVRARNFNDAYRSYGGRFEAGFTDVKWADNLMLNFNISDVYDEVQHGLYMTTPYNGRFSEAKASVIGIDYSKKNLFTRGLKFAFNAVYSDREQYIEDTVSYRYNWDGQIARTIKGDLLKNQAGAQQSAPSMLTINQQSTSLRSTLSYDIVRNHRLTLNYTYNSVRRRDNDALKPVLDQLYKNTNDLSKNVTSISYEMEAFNSKLKTNLFSKFYQQKTERTEPTVQKVNGVDTRVENVYNDNRRNTGYGLALSYAIRPNLFLISSAEKAIRMPSANDIFGNQAENMTPNLTIRPEMSNNFNLGFRAGVFDLNQHKVSFSASGFIRDTKDKIATRSNDRTVANVTVQNQVNLNGVEAIGFEAEANYIYKNLNVMLNASKFNAILRDPNSLFNGQQTPNEPFFTINANAQYRAPNLVQKGSMLNLYYNLGYVKDFSIIWWTGGRGDRQLTPVQLIQDIGASYRFPNRKLVASFDAKNIFNRQAFDNFAAQKPGRAFYLKLNYTINNF